MLTRLLVVVTLPLLPLGCVVASPPGGGDAPSSGGNAGTGGHDATGGGAGDGTGGSSDGSGGHGDGMGGSSDAGGVVSTRDGGKDAGKGIPAAPWVNVTADLFAKTPDGGEVFLLSSKPGEGRVIAGLAHSKLWETVDGGQTWDAIGVSDGSMSITNLPTTIVYDPDHPETFWESGSYGDGVFKTVDDGRSFQKLGDTQHDEILSIDFTDPKRKTLLAGAHETNNKLYLSVDGGDTWTDIGPNLPSGSNWSSNPQIIDANTFLLGSCGGSGTCGVFRSTDRGQTWASATTQGPTGRPLWTSSGAIYWQLAGPGVIMSTDKGVSWTLTGDGPVHNMTGTLAELPDGRVVALGSDHLLATSNNGKSWKPIGAKLPAAGGNCGIYGFVYSPEFKKFFLNHNSCSGNLLQDAIYTEDFDYTME